MKKHVLTLLATVIVNISFAQLTPCPLDFSHIDASIFFLSVPSHDVVWGGTVGQTGTTYFNSKLFVKSTDAGATWLTDTIPATGDIGISSIFAYDENTAWVTLSDFLGMGQSAVWKTTDGGVSWQEKTTNQFSGPLNFADDVIFFSPDSGVVLADSGYTKFIIYTTIDGGTTWDRVSDINTPLPIMNEYLPGNFYSKDGDKLSVVTSQGRYMYSTDKGYTWNIRAISAGNFLGVEFNDEMNGITYHDVASGTPSVFKTTDGGVHWSIKTLTPAIQLYVASSIKNIPGAYVFKSGPDLYATTDFFASYFQIFHSTLPDVASIRMFDATIGYTGDTLNSDSAIYKIEGMFTSIKEPGVEVNSFSVFPNPVVADNALASFSLDKTGEVSICFIDAAGRIIKQQTIYGTKGKNGARLDCGDLHAGNYVVKIIGDKEVYTSKISVSKPE